MVHAGCVFVASIHRLGRERQDLLSPSDRLHVCTDQASVYTLIRKSFGGLEPEPMLTPRGKSPLLESVRRNACVHKLDLGVYSHQKEFWGLESEPILTPRGKSPLPEKNSPQRRIEPSCIKQEIEPNTLPTSYSGPCCQNET